MGVPVLGCSHTAIRSRVRYSVDEPLGRHTLGIVLAIGHSTT